MTRGRADDAAALARGFAPGVLATLARRHGAFADCEDAVQAALIAAAACWPTEGVPDDPRAWLITVAGRRLIDGWRSASSRREREASAALDRAPVVPEADDSLLLFVLCCHPVLSSPSRIALTLRAVGGLSTAEIAAAFLVPEATMAQRISRAKASISTAGATFELPAAEELPQRVGAVARVLYLVFNEGYVASSGDRTIRGELTAEAIRLTRMLRDAAPGDPEVAGLLALMLLIDARRSAREVGGDLIPLAEQDRARWDAGQIAEGIALVSRTLGSGPVGPYQVQAAIAALHDEAPTALDTDWRQILALYEVLETIEPGPMVTLNRAVAVGMVDGPLAALALVGTLDEAGLRTHRVAAVRAHLLEMAGDAVGARASYLTAASRTGSRPEQRYLALRAARLVPPTG